ncbi:MAG: hypothetical protein ACMG6E_06755 [Candidatus Roizmanbacteria bacterium]
MYLAFSQEEDEQVQRSIAASIHEALLLSSPEEDISKLRECFKSLLEDPNKDVIKALGANLKSSIDRFCNEQAIK